MTNFRINTAEKAISDEIAAIELELEQSPVFRRLCVLRKVLKELQAMEKPAALSVAGEPSGPEPAPTAPSQFDRKFASSIAEAVMFSLEEAGVPLPTRQLLEDIAKFGKTVRAKNPVWGLSNTLSTDHRFVSIPWEGGRAWWFAGRPVPEIKSELF